MELTLEQVVQLAPDEKSVASARQLLSPRFWSQLGMNEEAIWGECRGSAVYSVRIDLSNLGQSCNCPSRKRPCRHSLGLLMLFAASPEFVPTASPPPEVREWLDKRQARAEKQAAKADAPEKPVDEVARQKRVEQREGRIQEGIASLRVFLRDLIRTGIAGIEGRGTAIWEEQAKRLVDAQAPGLAGRIRFISEIPGSSIDWPQHLLDALGRLELLLVAYSRLSELDEDLQHEVRQLIGWNVQQADLEQYGERVTDNWFVLGTKEEDGDRLRTQRIWLQSLTTGRFAVVIQVAPGKQPYPDVWMSGVEVCATLLFYPGTSRQRARVIERTTVPVGNSEMQKAEFSGAQSVDQMLQSVAEQLARQPWQFSFPVILKDVTVVKLGVEWLIRDAAGQAVPLLYAEPWSLLAISGGNPLSLFGEWDGQFFAPISTLHEFRELT
ncbi:SWIM zinc finger family protein [Planctomicrobium sp. SH527]|uniref:SWIM zinc finger family protein n=1 Tax=Planctomicrobium sp. SH527 TaxID=3448123 RepID=UPI003F5C6599